MYVTEEGLTYVQTRYEKGSGQGPKPPGGEAKRKPVHCERIDMVLAGATITRENVVKEEPGMAHYNFLYGPGDLSIYGVKKYRRLTIRN